MDIKIYLNLTNKGIGAGFAGGGVEAGGDHLEGEVAPGRSSGRGGSLIPGDGVPLAYLWIGFSAIFTRKSPNTE